MPKNWVDFSIALLEGALFVAILVEVIRSFRIVRVAKRLDAKRKSDRGEHE